VSSASAAQTVEPHAELHAIPEWARYALAAVAVVPVLSTVFQTLVLTDVTDDVIRKGIEAEPYSMLWSTVCWGVAILYGVFIAMWSMPRFGARITLNAGLLLFAIGNFLCGAAFDLTSLMGAKLVEGLGKGIAMVLCRAVLYRQFDRGVAIAITFYGVCAYATRPSTPFITAAVNDTLSWRWIFWVNVPLALLGLWLVKSFIKPDLPPKPMPLRIDWINVTMFVVWVVSLLFVFSWYRKWGGWTSNLFAVQAALAMTLPVVLVVRVVRAFSRDEHLQRMLRVRLYIGAMCTRMLLLLELGAVLGLMGKYFVELRDYPRATAGMIMAAATPAMAISTLLTMVFHRRSMRIVWFLVAVFGSAATLWWMSSIDNFTSKQQLAGMMACWGLCIGLFPPVFLPTEVEYLDRRDALYGGVIAIVCLIVPLLTIPTAMSTVVSAWSDRALDAQRQNIRENSPEVQSAQGRVADYYRQRGVDGPELSQLTGRVLGGFATVESVSHGISSGLRFLSIVFAVLGVLTALLLANPPTPAATAPAPTPTHR
jgi:MFS family permease